MAFGLSDQRGDVQNTCVGMPRSAMCSSALMSIISNMASDKDLVRWLFLEEQKKRGELELGSSKCLLRLWPGGSNHGSHGIVFVHLAQGLSWSN